MQRAVEVIGGGVVGRRALVVGQGGTGGFEQRGFFEDFQRRTAIECFSPPNFLCGAVAG